MSNVDANLGENGSKKSDDVGIPSVVEIQKAMRKLSIQLYHAWRAELRERLLNLEFDGYITKEDIEVDPGVWRLPNNEVRFALSKLQDELDHQGYEYEFKFDDVDDVYWIMFYSIELPDELDDMDAVEENTEQV
jgi:DNA-binding Lrp family transcriptional regulator